MSSDSEKIKNYCKKFKRLEILERPKNISKNSTSMHDLMKYILKFQVKENYKYLIILQPTSPLRNKKDIIDCYKLIRLKKLDAVWTISKIDKKFNPIKILRI